MLEPSPKASLPLRFERHRLAIRKLSWALEDWDFTGQVSGPNPLRPPVATVIVNVSSDR